MAFPEEQPKETPQDGAVQQDGIQRKVITDCNQNENSGGIHIPKETEASPRIVDPVSVGNDICVSCQHDSQSIKEDDINDIPNADAGGPAESKSETKSRSGRDEEMPVSQNHEGSSYTKYGERIPGRKRRKQNQLLQSHTRSSWFQTQMVGLIFFILLFENSSVRANELGNFGILAIVLNCTGPPSSVKNWLSGWTPIVKNGILDQACRCCQHLFLTETGDLNITNIGGNRDLCDYQCAIQPSTAAIDQFSVKEFFELCYVENSLKFKEFLSINSRAEFKMRRNADSKWIYHFNVTNWNAKLVMSRARSERQDINGSSYCNFTLNKTEGKNETHAVKPGKTQGENENVVIITYRILTLVACLVYQLIKCLCKKKEDESSTEAMIPEEMQLYYYD